MSLVGFKAQNHPQQSRKDAVDDRSTRPELFDPLDARFGFTLDAAASRHNAKCQRYYDIEGDGLRRTWRGERVWCNPPYSDIESWVVKAWNSWDYTPGAELIVMLLPANRTEQKWWQVWVEPALRSRRRDFRVEFLPGRPRFDRPDWSPGPKGDRPPFGCCLLIWDWPAARGVVGATTGGTNE